MRNGDLTPALTLLAVLLHAGCAATTAGGAARSAGAPTAPRDAHADPKSPVQLTFDAKGVDFRRWLKDFAKRVKQNWRIPDEALSQHGDTSVAFDVHRDGSIALISITRSSGVQVFDRAAADALTASSPATPLPASYPDETMHVTMTFYYNENPRTGNAWNP